MSRAIHEQRHIHRGVRAIAARLRLSVPTVLALIAASRISHSRVGPARRVIEVSEDDALRYEQSCRVEVAA
jgi:hypothetical protein